MNIFRVW